ncbi:MULTISPECIES: hypothetical protein [unclassified Pseudomonas]|uniref:hypothetical protein n=1 Tax=unclassified Pseudomonas TaxID=196821 RepID=UPI0015A0EFDD|nr:MULTISPECIES: hypothetical protein [unclassified Pseudomonas]NWC92385.1 hypothetical protein [Pseudomonas sp. IPO3779]NWD19833.1 hypothetical protein [Pseudomonas sp. IPO3778]
MTLSIKTAVTPAGEQLINIPADVEILKNLGFSVEQAEQLCIEAAKTTQLESSIAARRTLYVTEADPLFLEWQYDETPEKEKAWRDKVAEIKALYPLPDRT